MSIARVRSRTIAVSILRTLDSWLFAIGSLNRDEKKCFHSASICVASSVMLSSTSQPPARSPAIHARVSPRHVGLDLREILFLKWLAKPPLDNAKHWTRGAGHFAGPPCAVVTFRPQGELVSPSICAYQRPRTGDLMIRRKRANSARHRSRLPCRSSPSRYLIRKQMTRQSIDWPATSRHGNVMHQTL